MKSVHNKLIISAYLIILNPRHICLSSVSLPNLFSLFFTSPKPGSRFFFIHAHFASKYPVLIWFFCRKWILAGRQPIFSISASPKMMSSTIEHFSHLEHSLELMDDVIINVVDAAICYGCKKPVIGSPTYICSSRDSSYCEKLYLHKSCAELPTQITYYKHKIHPLTLFPCRDWEFFTYACIFSISDMHRYFDLMTLLRHLRWKN